MSLEIIFNIILLFNNHKHQEKTALYLTTKKRCVFNIKNTSFYIYLYALKPKSSTSDDIYSGFDSNFFE